MGRETTPAADAPLAAARAAGVGHFYDANQMDTELRPCTKCGREGYFRPWRTVCPPCDGYPHVAKVTP